jgi:hypothetical protein
MDPVVQAAGTALVQTITSDGWEQVKQAVAGLWRRVYPRRADQIGRELEELRQQVLRARSGGDAETEHALEGAWQLRLQELVCADPALAPHLRRVLDQVLTPALPTAGQARVRTILMTGISRDSSTFTQIGTQIINGRP